MNGKNVVVVPTENGYVAALVQDLATSEAPEEAIARLIHANPKLYEGRVFSRHQEGGWTVCLKESPELCVSAPTERQALLKVFENHFERFVTVLNLSMVSHV